MTYCMNKPVSAKAIADLRHSVNWNRMESAYNNPKYSSYAHIAVYDDNRLVGYIDSVSNGVTDAYIQDLMVHPNYQNQGIGTELMNRMIDFLKSQNIFMISVVFDNSLRAFYRRFGFCEMFSGQLQTYECE